MNLLGYEISEIYLLIGLVAVLLLSGIFHLRYLRMIESMVRKTADSDFDFEDLMKSLHISQGSNFNIIMIFSWSLFFVALAFLYFLTPDIFPDWNYFKFPQVASWEGGFAVMGIAVLIPGLFVSLFVPRAYSYYLVHRILKEKVILIPAFLLASILCSVNLGTIYPATDPFLWNLGYVMVFAALALMIAPIFVGFLEEWRK
ncbi:MAG: hypothetical protein NTV25_02865 [Methanothrix sp.]|jgi:uncharacterized membrane protein|nr:hypothetical protein [Methanothrix sp.]